MVLIISPIDSVICCISSLVLHLGAGAETLPQGAIQQASDIDRITTTVSDIATKTEENNSNVKKALSCVASEDFVARLPTSFATTAKPLPASPALAASMEALSDNMFVWKASETQAAAVEEISEGIKSVNSAIHNTTATAEQSAAESEELSALALTLSNAVSRFNCVKNDI